MANKIRVCTLDDVTTLQQISRETFRDTFSVGTADDNMEAFLAEAYAIPKLTREMNFPTSNFYFIQVAGEVAGYIKLNVGNAQSEPMPDDHLEIERLYVRPRFKHQGLGGQLMRFAIATAEQFKKDYVWLGVWEHNEDAKGFYQHYGFTPFSDHVFTVGDDRQRDILMVKPI